MVVGLRYVCVPRIVMMVTCNYVLRAKSSWPILHVISCGIRRTFLANVSVKSRDLV